MARYNFLTGQFEAEENMTPDRNVAELAAHEASANIQPEPDVADKIDGTRTSDTVFTRSAGTWTADELIGMFLWSFATAVPKTGEFLKIADNATDTVTIDSSYGNGALQTTGTSIIVLETTDEAEAMRMLEAMSGWVKTS